MAIYLTLDGGTTNTRLYLVKDGEVLSSLALPVGAGRTEGAEYRATIAKGAERILAEAGVAAADVAAFLASGLVTSDRGLCEVPHLPAPAGLTELRRGLVTVFLPNFPLPVTLIPGVKKKGARAEETDMMRGEETEIMGLSVRGTVILPGSHTKVIRLDGEGRIADFSTLLTGEMIAALSGHTILAHAVKLGTEPDPSALLRGAEAAERLGLSAALFKTRILTTQFGATPEEALGFFLGCLLSEEVKAVKAVTPDRDTPITVAGKEALKRPIAALLEEKGYTVRCATNEEVEASTVRGAVRIFEAE